MEKKYCFNLALVKVVLFPNQSSKHIYLVVFKRNSLLHNYTFSVFFLFQSMLNMLESYALGKNHQVHCLFSDSLSAHSFRHILVFNLLLATKFPCRWGWGMGTQVFAWEMECEPWIFGTIGWNDVPGNSLCSHLLSTIVYHNLGWYISADP